MSGQRQDRTRTRDLFEAMVREDDDEKRAELRHEYVASVLAENEKALARFRSFHRSSLAARFENEGVSALILIPPMFIGAGVTEIVEGNSVLGMALGAAGYLALWLASRIRPRRQA